MMYKKVVLIGLIFCTQIPLFAQKIVLDFDNVSLEEVINVIESKTDFKFLYNKQLVDVSRKVSVSVKDKEINIAINEILKGTNISYTILGKQIVLSKIEEKEETQILSGKVRDNTGEPLVGVSVLQKGTTRGVVTDVDGSFKINVPQGTTLKFSSVGYKDVEMAASAGMVVNLEDNAQQIDDVVVVGYGTQKRANLTGAVEQVTSQVFENRHMSNAVQGLQGAVPNLNISFSDGKPLRSSDFNIRGGTSIGSGGSALVLIDGVEGDPSLLNPSDIASVSVLKDASSAAIYGARGAFGVVLITTRSPDKDRFSVSYNGHFSILSPTVVPDMLSDTYEYTKMYLEASKGWNGVVPTKFHNTVLYSQAWFDEVANRRPGSGKPEVEVNPADGRYQYYANNNWYDFLYKKQTYSHTHDVTIQGATERADFIISGRAHNQGGIFRYNSDEYSMYNMRGKGSAQIFKWLRVENNFDYNLMNYHNPLTVAEGIVWYGLESEGQPMSPMFNPDGTLTMSAAYSVGDMWYGKSYMNTQRQSLRNTVSAVASFFDNHFRVKGDFTFRNKNENIVSKRVPVPYSTTKGVIAYAGTNTNDYSEANNGTNYMATNIYTEYENTFNKMHYVKGMVGYNYEQEIYKNVYSRRNGLLFEDVESINLTNGTTMNIVSDYYKWIISGGFFRLNYSFKDRYLLEVNGRLDASTKFPVNQQWGFFPSASVGWRISEESFWKVNPKYVSNLKLRFSYGSLGNGNVANYAYRELFKVSQSTTLIEGQFKQRTTYPSIIPDGLTWETSTTGNLGLDVTFLDSRLHFSGDAYIRKTTDMFTIGATLPAVYGATAPKGNYADMTTKGWEATLSWRDNVKLGNLPFNYEVRVFVADNLTKIDKYNNPDKNLSDYYEGQTLGEIWGYVTEGFFTSDDDVKNHASQQLYYATEVVGVFQAGDIKFKDINNDGVINYGQNKKDDAGDRKVIGNALPRYTFGINLGADWNNFFVSAFFQGVGKQNWWPGNDNALFWGQYNRTYNNVPNSMIGDIWTPDNTDAYFPRYVGYMALSGTRELSVPQTRYLQNVAYIRLKNLQVGYTLPQQWTIKAGIQKLSISLSAENLFSWSPLYKHTNNFDVATIYGADKENTDIITNTGSTNNIAPGGGSSYSYPILRSYSVGLSLTF